LCHVSSVPSSAQASRLGNNFGSEKGRRVDARVAVFLWAIMYPPLEFLIEAGIRASGDLSSTKSGVLSG